MRRPENSAQSEHRPRRSATWSQMGRVTRITSPPPSRGRATMWPPCARATDRAIDRPRPTPLSLPGPLRAQPPERLEKVVDLVRGNHRAGVRHDQDRLAVLVLGRHLHPAVLRARCSARRSAPGSGRSAPAARRCPGRPPDGARRGSSRPWPPPRACTWSTACVATSARSTGLRSTIWLSLRASSSRPSTSCSLRSFVASSVLPSCWSSTGAPGSERCTSSSVRLIASGVLQLVRGVADEALLGGERPLQPLQHVVEGVGELLQLVVRDRPARSGATGPIRPPRARCG